jgi:flagellin
MASGHAALQRMRELAVQAASDTNDAGDRAALDAEYQQLLEELDDIARQTLFNGRPLLYDPAGGDPPRLTIQFGPDAGDTFELDIGGVTPASLGVSGTHVRTRAAASDTLNSLDGAVDRISGERASLGAVQAWMDRNISNLGMLAENLTEADSRIRDADIADEATRLTRAHLLAHISVAMTAQAGVLAGSVLFLLANQMMSPQPAANGAGAAAGAEQEPGTAGALPEAYS